MKKILNLVLLCLMLFCSGCGKKQPADTLEAVIERGVIRAGVRIDAEPFGFINKTGKNDGFDVDIARHIAYKILGSPDKIEFVPVSAAGRIETLTSDRADIMAAAMSKTPEREKIIDFSNPYYTAGQTAVVRKRSRIYSFADLKDRTVIIVSGSTAKKNLRRIMPSVRIVEYENYNKAFQAFKDGGGDALCADDAIISGFTARNEDFRIFNSRISSEHYSIGVKKTEDKALIKKLNTIIDEMQMDGLIRELKKKHGLP